MTATGHPANAWAARFSRRRAISILAAAGGLPLFSSQEQSPAGLPLYRWEGSSLGSPSRVLICHPERAIARRALTACVAEIERLERVFGLHCRDSELARLNASGRLADASLDLLTVLSLSLRLSALTDGAFDVSVQPLWELYAAHFFAGAAPASCEPPSEAAIARARALVDWRSIDLNSHGVALVRPGMGLTLNGIAQGYVTDRIIDILRNSGCDRVLADLGRSEISALGVRGDARPWRVGLADPRQPEKISRTLQLTNCAVCTSGGYGMRFEPSGQFHHLFDPITGRSANTYLTVSVLNRSAMLADALSTALYVTAADRTARVVAEFAQVRAYLTRTDATVWEVAS